MNKRRLGADYENIAIVYLRSEGYHILERNFRCRLGEIDVIAMKNGYLHFIEVKYRSVKTLGLPEEAVDYKKQRQISKVASYYIMKKEKFLDIPCCFDVIAILDNEIKFYENAFEYCE